MKRFAFTGVLCACLLTVSSSSVRAEHYISDSMRKKIEIPLAQPSTEDYLLAIARAGEVNFLVDATNLPQTAPPFTGEWKDSATSASNGQWTGFLSSILLNLAYDRDLTWAWLDNQTYVVWPDQHFEKLGKRIAGGEGIAMAGEVLPDDKFIALLQDYVKREHGWDGKSSDFKLDIKFDDLPPSIRPFVVAKAQERFLNFRKPFTNQKNWFFDEFWKDAVIVVTKEVSLKGPEIRNLAVGRIFTIQEGGQPQRRHILRRIATVKNYVVNPAFPKAGRELTLFEREDAFSFAPSGDSQSPAPPAVPAASLQVLSPTELEKEATLAAHVSLDVKRRSVNALLADVQKTSGVVLTARAGAVPANALVTAYVKEMPLSSFMAALSRLYNVRWSKADDGYAMNPSDLGEVEQKLSHIGDFFRFLQRTLAVDTIPKHLKNKPFIPYNFGWGHENAPLAEEIWPYVSGGDLRKGVPFATLPEELQQRVRAFIEDEVGDAMVQNIAFTNKELQDGYRLKIGRGNSDSVGLTPESEAEVIAAQKPPLGAFFADSNGIRRYGFALVTKEEAAKEEAAKKEAG